MNAVVVRSTSSARQKSCRTSAAASRSASPRRNYLVFSGLRPEPPKPLPRLCLVPQTRPDFCRAVLVADELGLGGDVAHVAEVANELHAAPLELQEDKIRGPLCAGHVGRAREPSFQTHHAERDVLVLVPGKIG